MFFLGFPKNFQSSCVKEQLYVHAVDTLEETDGLLKDLLWIALSLVIHKIFKFKTFLLLLRCSTWSSDTKNIPNCIIVIFHLCLTKPSFEPTGYDVGSHFLFHNWCKTINCFYSLLPRKIQKCIWVYVCERESFHLCWK